MKKTRVLYICLSDRWGTVEKNVLKDIEEGSFNGVLYCYKDSFVDLKAKRLNIPIIYCRRGRVETRFDFQMYLDFRNIINEYDFEVIFTTHFKSLWLMCFLLRNDFTRSLIFYSSKVYSKAFHGPILRLLARRIDRIFVTSQGHKQNVLKSFKILSSRVINTGLGLDFNEFIHESNSDRIWVSCLVPSHGTSLKTFDILLRAFIICMGKSSKTLYLNLVTEKKWESHILYNEFQQFTMAHHIEQNVIYSTMNDDYIDHSSLWVDLGIDKSTASNAYQAFCAGIKILLGRTPVVFDSLRYGPVNIETVNPNDPRELSSKILKLLKTQTSKAKKYHEFIEVIKQENDRKFYQEKTFINMENLVKKRVAPGVSV